MSLGSTTRFVLLSLSCTLVPSVSRAAACEAINLRVESQVNPLGVDTPRPRLSWQVADSRRGAKQTGCRILVASKPELLREGKADLWDSLLMNSDRTIDVGYGGKRLGSRQQSFWTVKIWDKDGKPSAWSKPAHWETPFLNQYEWKAHWIGVMPGQNEEKPDSLEGVQWIWAADAKPGRDYAAGKRWFRTTFELPNKTIKSAMLIGAVDEQFTAYINGQTVGSGSGWVNAASYPVNSLLKPGKNLVAVEGNNSGGLAGLAILVRVTFADGTTERVASGPSWQSAMTVPNRWQDTADSMGWERVSVLGDVGPGIWGMPKILSAELGGPASLLRKTITISKPIAKARVYVTARGSYRLRINGKRVGNDILTPDWTDYRKRIPYQIYDVTKMLHGGENAIGAILGDGWYASGLGWTLQRWSFGAKPTQLLLQMHIDYADGSSDTIITDGSWKWAEGAIQRSEIYAGETYDARKEQPGWDNASFSDTGWKPVNFTQAVGTANGGTEAGKPLTVAVLVPQTSPTIQITSGVKPLAITNPSPGVYIYDMGQNMVGWVRLQVHGKSGDKIRMRFAEILQPNGQIYTENLRRAEATDTYTCKGGADTWEPHFTYHGFRKRPDFTLFLLRSSKLRDA